MTDLIWLAVVMVGAALIGAFIYYGQEKTEQPESVNTKRRRDAATRAQYDGPDSRD